MLYHQMTGYMGVRAPTEMENGAIRFPEPADAVLFLDFDGTLVEIADRPMEVVVEQGVRDLLDRAMQMLDGRVVLVSGRTIADLEHFLPDFRGTMIGTHGAEVRKEMVWSQAVSFDVATVSRLQRLVSDFAALRPELLVEMKPSGVVLHYRQAEEYGGLAMNFMDSLAAATDGFKVQPALMAFELKPEDVGKDIAVQRLLADGPLAGRTAIFAGDDLTDEPALKLVQEAGGIAIKIGQAETVAEHRLPGPADLISHLSRWLA
ncbi:MAG: trehalose-phosphatase [Pseudomonadota bacterium]